MVQSGHTLRRNQGNFCPALSVTTKQACPILRQSTAAGSGGRAWRGLLIPWGNVLTSADGGVTHHAHFRLPWHRLSDRLAFGASTDGRGRHGYSSCNTRWNTIAVSADPRRGFIEPPRLIGSSNRSGLP